MAFHLKPKEEKFFSLLDQHATLSYEAAELLSQAINGEVAKETALEKTAKLRRRKDSAGFTGNKRGINMKTFWHVLTTPEEWSLISIILVGLMFLWTFSVLFGEAFDANFPA